MFVGTEKTSGDNLYLIKVEPLLSDFLGGVTIRSDNRKVEK